VLAWRVADDPLRAAIAKDDVFEREGWRVELVARVTEALQRDVVPAARFETVVSWSEAHASFTGPGRTIYVSRQLLDRVPDDHAAAIVIARELAHHRLGHVPPLPPGTLALFKPAFVVTMLQRWMTHGERARAADLVAIELCIDAGFDPARCLAAFEHLEASREEERLDRARAEGTRVPRPAVADRVEARIDTRIDALRAHVDAVHRGERFAVHASRARERQRQRLAAAGAGVLGAIALALLLGRR
jgi:hypothetical protein